MKIREAQYGTIKRECFELESVDCDGSIFLLKFKCVIHSFRKTKTNYRSSSGGMYGAVYLVKDELHVIGDEEHWSQPDGARKEEYILFALLHQNFWYSTVDFNHD